MENKIYNAIQKGIANALVIDGDSAINYQKTHIDNRNKINFNVLMDMCAESFDILFQVDTFDFFRIIGNDGKEYPLADYKNLVNPVILMAKFPENPDWMYIALQKAHCINCENSVWQGYLIDQKNEKYTSDNVKYDKMDIEDARTMAKKDFNGYKHTQEYMQNYVKISQWANIQYYCCGIFAAEYCNMQKIDINGIEYKGYLPASGEIYLIFKYFDLLDYIFEKFNTEKLCNLYGGLFYLWTSTEYNDSHAWACGKKYGLIYPTKDGYQIAGRNHQTYPIYVMPLFKKIN